MNIRTQLSFYTGFTNYKSIFKPKAFEMFGSDFHVGLYVLLNCCYIESRLTNIGGDNAKEKLVLHSSLLMSSSSANLMVLSANPARPLLLTSSLTS